MSDKDLPPPELLRQLLRYEPETGKLYWRPRPAEMFKSEDISLAWNKIYAGKEAFTYKRPDGYLSGCVFSKKYHAHRVIAAIVLGEWPSQAVDHINRNKSDNRWCNIRLATRNENNRNTSSRKNSISKYLGVSWRKDAKKWTAQISFLGKQKHLGMFLFEEDAAAAYDKAASKLFGEFANLNFPDNHS